MAGRSWKAPRTSSSCTPLGTYWGSVLSGSGNIEGFVSGEPFRQVGRTTYEEFAGYWSQQTGPMADAFNGMRKPVASQTLTAAEWNNSEIVDGDLIERLSTLKNTPGRNINTSGSISVVRALLEAGLLDDLHLMLFPIVLGTGTRLFLEHGKRVDMTLAGTHTFGSGVVHLHYRLGAAA
ncbi:dihydrofolate reductase family protein [Streptomyces populi]|uniref:dihydrofolate reductase family protein n=1 Tax=Streptomyces populi TaxID=2058924 RepID=UPI0013A6BEF7|nr:dihydrofolate reductase family protein [Streptomyces populi]